MYIIPLFYHTCKKKRPVSKKFFRTPQGDGGRLPLFRSTESCELSGPPAGPLPGFPFPGRKEARCRGRTAPFLRGDSGQCWFIQKGRGAFCRTEVECRLFCCPILLGRCRFCSFLKLLSYRHTAKPLFFCSACQQNIRCHSEPVPDYRSFRGSPQTGVGIPRLNGTWERCPPMLCVEIGGDLYANRYAAPFNRGIFTPVTSATGSE